MIYGRIPPGDDNLGSWWTKVRDALNPVKLVSSSSTLVSKVADKLNITPLQQMSDEIARTADKVYAEGTRAGENPTVVKIGAAIGAAVLTYFGQVSAAQALIQAGNAYAKGLQAKKDFAKSEAEYKKDEETATFLNTIIPYMSANDAQTISTLYEQQGYRVLDREDVKAVIAKAKETRDADFLYNLKLYANQITVDTNDSRLPTLAIYINQIVGGAIDLRVPSSEKSRVLNQVESIIFGELEALPESSKVYLSSAFAGKGEGAINDANVSAIIVPIAKKCVALIAKEVALSKGQTPEQAVITSQNVSDMIQPPPTAVDSVLSFVPQEYRKYWPYAAAALAVIILDR